MTYRDVCGGPRGAAAHQRAGEPLCGWCRHGEAVARLAAEAMPARPPVLRIEPVAARRALLEEIDTGGEQ